MSEHDWRRGFDPRTDCDEWPAGYAARVAELNPMTANPYPKHTTEHELWYEGWLAADEALDGATS